MFLVGDLAKNTNLEVTIGIPTLSKYKGLKIGTDIICEFPTTKDPAKTYHKQYTEGEDEQGRNPGYKLVNLIIYPDDLKKERVISYGFVIDTQETNAKNAFNIT